MRAADLRWVLGAAALCGACGAADAGSDVTVRDSAGVEIVENHEPQWPAGERWTVSAEPTLEIGVASGDPRYEFTRIVAMVRLGDGRIVVADAGTSTIRWYDSTGRHLVTAGGEGEGPGEFRLLAWIGRGAGDSVMAWDALAHRLTVFGPRGRYERDARVTFEQQVSAVFAAGGGGDGGLVLELQRMIPEEVSEPQVRRLPLDVLVVDTDGEIRATLGPFPGMSTYMKPGARAGILIRHPAPFGASTVSTGSAGRVWVGDNETFRIAEYDATGALRRLIGRSAAPVRVTGAHVAAEYELRVSTAPPVESLREGIRALLAEIPVPDHMPAYSDLIPDGEGRLWAKLPQPDPAAGAVWSVFDNDGRWLGDVRMPRGFELMEVGRFYVLGRLISAHDVPLVHVHELIKSGDGA